MRKRSWTSPEIHIKELNQQKTTLSASLKEQPPITNKKNIDESKQNTAKNSTAFFSFFLSKTGLLKLLCSTSSNLRYDESCDKKANFVENQ